MNNKLKKMIALPIACIASAIITTSTPANANIFDGIKNSLSSSIKSENGESNFDFIKSNQKAKDFIYDGSLLLYGGIAFITISVFGIFFTLKPKRKKKRSRKNITKSSTL